MFKKIKCSKCGKKIEERYSFCPYCGDRIELEDEGDFGMLGRSDFMSAESDSMFPSGLNTIFNSIIKNLSKELDGQLGNNFAREEKPKKIKKDGISISISTFGDGPPKIRVNDMRVKQENSKPIEKIKNKTFNAEKIKKFASLKKEEPITNIRRLSNRVIYELGMPDVNSVDDISIIKLENSIEIKAIGKSKAYAKLIPINLPIANYDFSDGRLVLELGIKN